MKQVSVKGISLWKFENLQKLPGILHFVSGRKGGESTGDFAGLNLGLSVGDSREAVIKNRALLAGSLDIKSDQLYFVSQYHSDQVHVATGTYDGEPVKADAIVTNVKGICICVMGADCTPVLVYDPVNKAIGAIHAGWRGTAASVTLKTLQKMQAEFGSRAEDMILSIGPSISQEKYEVGEDVFNSFKQQQNEGSGKYFRYDSVKQKYFPDLWLANKEQGLEAGIKDINIEVAGICTYSNPEDFYSARYFKNKTGRFAAGIMLI